MRKYSAMRLKPAATMREKRDGAAARPGERALMRRTWHC
jgi:hypothetical protein